MSKATTKFVATSKEPSDPKIPVAELENVQGWLMKHFAVLSQHGTPEEKDSVTLSLRQRLSMIVEHNLFATDWSQELLLPPRLFPHIQESCKQMKFGEHLFLHDLIENH